MAVRFNSNVYLFEFKVVELAPAGAAMAQLKEKRYADKYRALGEPIHLVAVEFSKDARNLTAFEVERWLRGLKGQGLAVDKAPRRQCNSSYVGKILEQATWDRVRNNTVAVA